MDNSYSLSGNLTKILGRYTLRFGGEARRIEWIMRSATAPARPTPSIRVTS